MENVEDQQSLPQEKITKMFSDFMTRIAKFEELVTIGSRLLVGFRQALGFIARPPIDKTSALVERIMKAHGTRRFLSYVEAGCMNSHDSVQNVGQSKVVLTELKCLLDDVAPIVQSIKEQDEVYDGEEDSLLNPSKSEEVDYAVLMAIIFSMVRQDYTMQERIVSSLNLKSSQGELETYCQMWSLRPYVDDGIMHEAWNLIP